LLVVCAACAHDVVAVFPSRGEPAGTVVVELTEPAEDLTVAIGGALVVRHEHTRHVVVTGVPAGRVEVELAFGGGWYARAHQRESIDVVPGGESAVVVAGPERSTAGAIENGLVQLGTWVFLGLTYAALLG
jgi:hypothetical protein